MQIKGIIFDKDGTLLDFDAFWLAVSKKAIEQILAITNSTASEDEILRAFGVENGETDIRGALCSGTYAEMGELVYGVLRAHGCAHTKEQVCALVNQAYHDCVEYGQIRPTCDNLADVLRALKAKKILLAVVTTDDPFVTKKCLQGLGIEELFDEIYTDNGVYPVKPDPYCIDDLAKKYGLNKQEILMVGDTLTDVCFAKNGKIKVLGVAKNTRNQQVLEGQADYVRKDVSHLLKIID